MNEHEVLEGCRRGDREAQRELYERTCERIYRLLLRMTRDPDHASDLTQDTYLRAFTRIGQFDGRSTLGTWLYRIAVAECLQFLRRARRIQLCRREAIPDARVDSTSDRSMAVLDLEAALEALKPTDRTMLLLRYEHGLDYRAISQAVECAPGTVASRLNRARQRLRKLLGGDNFAREEIRDGGHPNATGSERRGHACRERTGE